MSAAIFKLKNNLSGQSFSTLKDFLLFFGKEFNSYIYQLSVEISRNSDNKSLIVHMFVCGDCSENQRACKRFKYL